MSKVTRATLREKSLEPFCKKASISHHECGPKDNRQFCYGIIDTRTDELIEPCKICKANVIYADCSEIK